MKRTSRYGLLPWFFFSVVLLSFLSNSVPAKGKLERIAEETRKKEKKRSEKTSSSESEESEIGEAAGDLIADFVWPMTKFVVMAPYMLPVSAAGESNEVPAEFPAHPYADGSEGYLDFGLEERDTDTWALRLALEDGNDFDGVNRANFSFLLSTRWRIGLQGAFNYFTENLRHGETDELYLGDLNLVVRFAQHPKFQFRSGLGFNVLGDDEGTEFGFNFTYGADFFPARHLVVSASIDAGTLGSASVIHPRATVGAIVGDWELYAGWDHRWVGSASVWGPVIGLRFWY